MAKTNYAINAMRAALVEAQKNGNRHAIYLKDCVKLGIPEERWLQWKIWCDDLLDVVVPYLKAADEGDDEKAKAARRKIFPAWRKILKTGEEDVFHPKMFVSEYDVDKLIGFANKYIYIKGVGSAPTSETQELFRKGVETLIGCRISGIKFIGAEDRDCIMDYQMASSKAKRLIKELDGEQKKDGYHPGIIATIKTTKASLTDMVDRINEVTALADGADGQIKEFLQGQIETLKKEVITTEGVIADLENQKKLKEQALADAKKIIDLTETKAKAKIQNIIAAR